MTTPHVTSLCLRRGPSQAGLNYGRFRAGPSQALAWAGPGRHSSAYAHARDVSMVMHTGGA